MSIPPWAVWTITGIWRSDFAQFRQHRHAVDIRHHQVENDQRQAVALGPGDARERFLAAFRDDRAIAESLDRGSEKPTLDRVVVDDKDGDRHIGAMIGVRS